MATNPTLSPLTLPAGTEFPGTPQLLLAMIAAYMEITGLDDLGGVNFGPTTPDAADRDKPWFKTDVSYNPIGWFCWNGSAWAQILFTMPSGTTANRPSTPTTGQQYFDTTIKVALIYNGSAWVTMDGSPGDVKHVKATSLANALTNNPGWVEYTAAAKRVIGSADGTTGYNDSDTAGSATITLTSDQLPAHTHTMNPPYGSSADNGDLGPYIVTSEDQSTGTRAFDSNTGSVGTGASVSVMQPTIFHWCLIKS